MVYRCLCCGKALEDKDVPIPVFVTVDEWGTQRFIGKVDYTCKTEP